MVDMFDLEVLARAIGRDLGDDLGVGKLGDNELALGIGIVIGGVRDLERELGEREAGILGAGADPGDAGVVERAAAGAPEARRSERRFGMLQAQAPKPDVMAPPRTIVDALLKADILAAAKQVERAERRRRIGPVEQEGPHHAPRASHVQPIGDRPTGGSEGRFELAPRPD